MTKVTSADFQKNFGTYKQVALNSPVEITIHGRPTLVLLSKKRFDELQKPERNTQDAGSNALELVRKEIMTPIEQMPLNITEDQISAIEDMFESGEGLRFAERPKS